MRPCHWLKLLLKRVQIFFPDHLQEASTTVEKRNISFIQFLRARAMILITHHADEMEYQLGKRNIMNLRISRLQIDNDIVHFRIEREKNGLLHINSASCSMEVCSIALKKRWEEISFFFWCLGNISFSWMYFPFWYFLFFLFFPPFKLQIVRFCVFY